MADLLHDMNLPIEPAYLRSKRPLKAAVEALYTWPLRLPRMLRPVARPEAAAVRRVLVIRHNHLGDAVVSAVLMDALRRLFPAARIEVLASRYNRDVYQWIPAVDEVHELPREAWARLGQLTRLRRRGYDVVFQTLFDEHYLHRVLEARYLAGPRGLVVGRARWTPLERLFDRAVALPVGSMPGKLLSLLTPWSADAASVLVREHPRAQLHLPDDAVQQARQRLMAVGLRSRSYVVLNLSAREQRRRFGVDQSVELAQALLARGHRVMLSAAPDDRERLQQVLARVPGAVAPEFTSLAQAMAAVSEAALYVGPDTGSVHFAAAAGVPCVVVFFDRGRPDIWSPYGVSFISVQALTGEAVEDVAASQLLTASIRLLQGEVVTEIQRGKPRLYPKPTDTKLPGSSVAA